MVKQLNDISFEDSEDEKPEDEINDKRLPCTVITEETLKRNLGPNTTKFHLDHHYWIRNFFLDKVGRTAPNLRELTIRRMEITEEAFAEMTKNYTELTVLDISHCKLIEPASVKHLLLENQDLEKFSASRTPLAIDDGVVHQIAALENLKFLDLSYAHGITDEGLGVFKDRKRPFKSLRINCLEGVTSAGLKDIITAC